mgnify:CR=1 FL=1
MARIIIAGAGLAGLSCALALNRFGFDVTVLEKKTFPFHKVCGEYVSNEVLPFLYSLGIDLGACGPAGLERLRVTSPSGRAFERRLDLGGFGVTRHRFDDLLYRACIARGVRILTGTRVGGTRCADSRSCARHPDGEPEADLVIGAWGKRSNLDQALGRSFFRNRSPYMAVKYHIRTAFPRDLIQLDMFPGGYSGICGVEEGMYSLCYLTRTDNLKRSGGIREMEERVLFTNRHLRAHLEKAADHGPPLVINQVSFEGKPPAAGHILFCGDSAGMVSPLFGNGMAIAIRSGKMLAEVIQTHLRSDPRLSDRSGLERRYEREWQRNFRYRLVAGRLMQAICLQPVLAEAALVALQVFPGAAGFVMKNSHGRPF